MQDLLSSLPFIYHILIFVVSVVIIFFAGQRLAKVAETIADRSGLGQAITGGLFLGAATSLPGLVASVTAAWQGYVEMAVSNAIGGIAAQTAFLGIADISLRRGNLEHAAASLANLMQAGLLIALLTLPLLAFTLPEWTFWEIHPVTVLMVAAYCYGMRLSSRTKADPMWHPHRTEVTQEDEGEAEKTRQSWTAALTSFVLLALLTAVAGWLTAETGIGAIKRMGLSESLVGGLFTAVSSSLPELVTSIAAVRNGAYTLAVGGIIGGNAFDSLFMAASDVAYRDGSIYHAITNQQLFLIALAILMTAVLTMGLVGRERRGIANIGFESFTILSLYGVALLTLFLAQ
ncbi:sodium:calcium antiporter [Roseibacillus ishigakijimensis]|uniref:Sodium:calcium antiporter n=1 Tax=Roseibacillus ishigakijimensis TaxID=454146 RepID=A0A934VM91_9BACT|nr:sodium:calcium antiporter [Roseibacillus ishigakijimensis]MBK1833851.1 sodium:calcium antiporter [Roseibacillus ishigakijimensis]